MQLCIYKVVTPGKKIQREEGSKKCLQFSCGGGSGGGSSVGRAFTLIQTYL